MPNRKKDILTSENINIHYEVCNLNKNGSVLVFLHGMGGNLRAWDKERDFFHSKKLSTIAIDLRGHGLSGNPEGIDQYKLSLLAKDVIEVIKKEKFKKYVTVGHCLGGMVSIEIETSSPNISKAAVLVDSSYKAPLLKTPLTEEGAPLKILRLLASVSPRYKIAKDDDFDKFVGSGDIDIPRLTSDILHTSLKSYLLLLEDTLQFDESRGIENIEKPILIIQGMKDIIVPPKTALKMKERIKTSSVDFIKGANHVLVINNPLDLSEEIYKFLKKLSFA